MKAIYLINLLRKKGLTGQSLADAMGISKASVSKIENGERENLSMKMLESAGQYLNKSSSELLKDLEKVRSTAQE